MTRTKRRLALLPALVAQFMFFYFQASAQCPQMEAIMIDACGTEQLNEFIIIRSGGGFNTADIELDFDANNNNLGPVNNDINTDNNNWSADPTPCGLTTGNTAAFTGCPNLIAVGPGVAIPANAIVVLQTSSNSANNLYNFSSLCGAGQCIYVIASSCVRSAGGFTNGGGGGTRTTTLSIAGTCIQSATYNTASVTGGNGAYYLPLTNMYGNAGCVAPPVSGPTLLPPNITPIPNVTVCGDYILPAITGTNLTGNQAYYTGPNGSGTQLNPGDVISATTTLYAFDQNGPVGCTDQEQFTVTIGTAPTVNQPADVTICATQNIVVPITGSPGATFPWTNDNTATGLPASGAGSINIPSANVAMPEVSLITVTPTQGSCTGTPVTFSVTVNPRPTVDDPPNQVLCGGEQIVVNFTGNGVNPTYSWTNNNPAIGVPASGSGDIDLPANNVSAPVTGTITVTASENGCSGTPQTFTVTVNPTPTVTPPADITVCGGQSVGVTITGSTNTTFNWTNDNPAIGLGAVGSGSISFPAAIVGNTEVATITITPTHNISGCDGTPVTFTITVNPGPAVDNPGNLTFCGGEFVLIDLMSATNPVLNWTNSNTAIGLTATSGSGDINFNAANVATTQVGTITVTPVENNCTGVAETFTITVNPAPFLAQPNNVTVCGGQTVTVNFTGSAGATFNWTNDNTAIGLMDSGSGGFTFATLASAVTEVATVTVTPNNGFCDGVARTFTITVNPVPVMNPPANITVCGTQPINVVFTPNTSTYTWTNSNVLTGLPAFGNGNINTPAANVTSTQTGTLTVTPNENGCPGPTTSFTVTVQQAPTVNQPGNIAICSGQSILINFSGSAGATFNWTNSNTAIGNIGASGTGNISLTAASVATQQVGTITVTPSNGSCNGQAVQFTITVNPLPTINQPANVSVCNGDSVSVNFMGSAGATSFSWTNNNTAIGLPASGNGNLHFLSAGVSTPQTATITVTPRMGNNCNGIPVTFTVTVNPGVSVNNPGNRSACVGDSVHVLFTGAGNPLFTWTNNNPLIGLAGNGTGDLHFLAANVVMPQTATITVTPLSPTGFAYVTNTTSDNISVIDLATNTVVATIPVGDGPRGVGISPDGQFVYVTNAFSDNVSVINTATNTVVATIPVGTAPLGVAVSPDGQRVYVTNTTANTVSVIDAATNTVIATIGAISQPYGVVFSPDGSRVYVTSHGSGNVTIIDPATNTIITTVAVGNGPYGIVISPDGSRIYVTNLFTNDVSVINTATNAVVATIPVGNFPIGVSISPDGSRVYVANQGSNTVSVIDATTNTVIATIPVGTNPMGLSLSPAGNFLYVANFINGNVSVINIATNSVVTNVNVGQGPIAFGNFITTGASACTGAPQTFTITVGPAPVIAKPNDATACGNATVNVAFNPPPGVTVNWTNSNPAIGLPASGSGNSLMFPAANVATQQTATITATPVLGTCSGAPVSFTITVSPRANGNIAGDLLLCAGDSSLLTASGGGTYEWDNGDTTAAITVMPMTPTSFTVIITNSFGCATAVSALVDVDEAPVAAIAGTTALCAGASTTLSASGGTAGYAWSTMANTSAITVTPAATTTYTVTVTNAFSCTATSSATVVVNQPDSLNIALLSCNPVDTGTVVQLLQNQFGCDSIIVAVTTLAPSDAVNLTASTCDPNGAGIFTQNLTNQFGCDSIVVTTITFDPAAIDTTVLTATTCDPSQAGSTQAMFNGSDGCDSIVITNTALIPGDTVALSQTTCDPSQAGVFTQNLTNQFGCDSIVATTVTLLPTDTVYQTASTCNPNQAGTFTQNLTNQAGCDSTVVTTVTFDPAAIDTTQITSTTCDPTQAGSTQALLSGTDGCDSLVITNTILLPGDTVMLNQTTCDPSQAGTFTQNLNNQAGCDSIVTTTIMLLPADTVYQTVSTCNPNQTGTFTQNLNNQFGCDSVVVTTVTFDPLAIDTTNIAATTCDPSQVGISLALLTGSDGCDSIVITNTALLPGNTVSLSATTCDPAQAGVFVQNLVNQFGCDSVVTTTVTLLPSNSVNLTATTCDPNQAGVFTQNLKNQFGCDSTVVTTVTLLPSDTKQFTLFTCDSSSAGVTTQHLTNQFGCDSTVIITAVFDPSLIDITFLTATTCDPTQAGSLQTTLTGADGCDSIIVLTTELLPSDTMTLIAFTCDPATAGVFIQTLQNQYGCDSLLISEVIFDPFPCAPSVGTTGTNVSCGGLTDGSFILSILNGQVPLRYDWAGSTGGAGTGQITDLTTPVVVENLPAGTYTITITDLSNQASTTATVILSEPPVLSVSANAVLAFNGFAISCSDATDGTVNSIVSGGAAPFDYEWNTGGDTPVLAGIGAGMYFLTVTDDNGCSALSSATVTAPPPISFALDVDPAMCGDSVVEAAIIAGGGLAPYNIAVDGNPITGTKPALGPGTHLIALTDANGCSADSTVTLDFPPPPQIFLSPDTSVVIGHPVRVEATTNLTTWNSLVWQPLPDTSCANCLIQEWMPQQSGIITATIVDTFGCSATASVRVLVERVIELYIPNVFSPNEDGFNDLWQINAGQSVLDLQEVQVFDRWGDLQYQWLNPVPANTWPGWDGMTRGKKAGPGVYVYYVKVKLADGSTTTVKGDVTITR